MSNWKYTDESQTVVSRVLEDGTNESCFAAALDVGMQIDPYVDPLPSVPQSILMKQARKVLLQAGYLVQISVIINAMPSPQKELAQIDWDTSNTVERGNPLVLEMAAELGLTDAQLDAMFIAGAAL